MIDSRFMCAKLTPTGDQHIEVQANDVLGAYIPQLRPALHITGQGTDEVGLFFDTRAIGNAFLSKTVTLDNLQFEENLALHLYADIGKWT